MSRVEREAPSDSKDATDGQADQPPAVTTPGTAPGTAPGCRALLAYLSLCIALLLGTIGVRWYLYKATEQKSFELQGEENLAAGTQNGRLTELLVEKRKMLRSFTLPVAILICVGLAGAILGQMMGTWRLWFPPPRGGAVEKFTLPRLMLTTLILQMLSLIGATGVAVVALFTFP